MSGSYSCFVLLRPPPRPPLFPYTTLFRSPAPRTPDGKPDFSGTWQPEVNPYRFDLIQDLKDEVKTRSEEHTSELQSPYDLVCRLLLEKKKATTTTHTARRSSSQASPSGPL